MTIDVRAIRAQTGMTQGAFADAFRIPVATLRDWEQDRRRPDTGSATYLKMIAADAAGVRDILTRVK